MFKKSLFRTIMIVFIFLCNLSIVKADTNLQPGTEKYGNPKVDSTLWKILTAFKAEGIKKAEYTAEKRLQSIEKEKICVELFINSRLISDTSDSQNLQIELVNSGGSIKSINPVSITVLLPITVLERYIIDERISYISLPRKPITEVIVTEGVEVTGAELLISSEPYKTNNNPIKIAVIDAGFYGYEQLIGTELPRETTLVSFLNSGGAGTSPHGTACAEVIYDMSPDSTLYLIPIEYDTDLASAVNYCIANDIKVISTSICFFGAGPKDGTGPINEVINWAYENGIIWITAAGNYGSRHYSGVFQDTDNDGWHNFSNDDEIIDITITNIPVFYVELEWDDWGTWNGVAYSGTSEDFDLFLYKYESGQWVLVESSENIQNGNDIPYEEIIRLNLPNGHYGISVKRTAGNKDVKLHVYIPKLSRDGFTDSQYIVPAQSICTGADSKDAITVGAFNFYDLSLAYYSSWGPTYDGRIKPDICAPTSVSTQSYGQYGFTGTSCAAPHAAGAAALLLSRLPYTAFEDIFLILTGRAIDEDTAGKDNKWGAGRLYLQR